MKISKKLPQFDGEAALFMSCGEYEAHFYIAHKGELNETKILKMPPRVEAKEKQGFIRQRGSRPNLASVSHGGRHVIDLRAKYSRLIRNIIHDFILEFKIREIYIFAPKYVMSRIINELPHKEKQTVRMQFYKEYIKENPIKLIEVFNNEIQAMHTMAIKNPEKPPILLK